MRVIEGFFHFQNWATKTDLQRALVNGGNSIDEDTPHLAKHVGSNSRYARRNLFLKILWASIHENTIFLFCGTICQ